jgi:hypothetical protein
MNKTTNNVWPAPSARGFFKINHKVCFNVSDLGASPRPRWRSARPGPHKFNDVICAKVRYRFPDRRLTVRPSYFHHSQTSETN